jgi:hypothetical protein
MSFGPDAVCLAALSNVGDAKVTACVDNVVVVEGGRAVATVSRAVVVVDVHGLAAMGMANKWHHFFCLGAQT